MLPQHQINVRKQSVSVFQKCDFSTEESGSLRMIETCWSNFKCFNVKKFYVCALVGVLIKCLVWCSVTDRVAISQFL